MNPITRSAWGMYIQACQYLGLPVDIKAHTTLNELLNIHPNLGFADTDHPCVNYMSIGIKGHQTTIGTDNIPLMDAVQHLPTHSGLYEIIPFILRPVDEDLSVAERSRYRLRRIEEHNGTPYVVYYLRVLDKSATVPQILYNRVENGSTDTQPFEAKTTDLKPTPQTLSNDLANITKGDYISVKAKVTFEMTEQDVAEVLNVCNIIYGDERYATISEFGFCTGLDAQVVGDFNGTSSSYTDAIGVQIASFISDIYALAFNKKKFTITADLGAGEAMLSTT